jgi:hypothetical protein
MATINLTNVISSTRPAGGAAVQFDKPVGSNLTAEQARALLTDIRAQITAGGTVQTGYLSLQKASNGEFTIENRSRFNAFGNKDGAAALVKDLIRIAYGDAIGTQSSAALETAIDAYLADKSFGKKLGTVSFVRLVNELEINTGGTAKADKKSSAQALLGAGGSLAVDATAIAKGATEIRAVHDRVDALQKATQGLMSQNIADSIPAALAQFTAHDDLAAEITRDFPGNQTLQARVGQFQSEQATLAAKLNTDIQGRVDTIRPPGQEGRVGALGGSGAVAALQDQVQGLQTLRSQLPQGLDSPILAATRSKVEAALSQAQGELAARQASTATQAALREQGPIKAFATRVAMLDKATQPLLRTDTDTANQIAAATTQFQAHTALQQEMARYNDGLDNVGLSQVITQLGSQKSELAAKLNTDISARVDTLRPPGQEIPVAGATSLSTQVNSLRAIKSAINAGQADAQEPVTPATRLKVDVALAAAGTALEAATAADQAEAVNAKGLIKETLDRLGLRADTPLARATSRLGEHDIPWALHQHQALSKGIGALEAAIDAMADRPAGQAELAGLQARLRETQGKLAERINADIIQIVADCKAGATTAAAGRDSEAVLRAGASLAQVRAVIQPRASNQAQPAQGVSCVSEGTAMAVDQALDDVMAAAVGAIETGEMQARLDKLLGTPQGGLASLTSRAEALNDLLQGMNLLATYVPAGAQADDMAALRTKTARQAHDTLDELKAELESTRSVGASDGAQASARGQALADFGSQVKRLLNQTQGAPALSGVLGEVQNLQAALPELTLNEARSLLLDWSSPGDPSKRIDPRVQQSIDGSSNKKALDADIVALYQRGLFHSGDAFMGRLAGVLAQGETGSLRWLTELAAGDPAAVNGLLNEPQWDDIALRLKKSAPDAQTPLAQATIERDHARHIALRTLDSLLRQQGVQTLLFAGINTDRCVFSSLQDAGFLGYDCVLLDDACATPSPAYVSRAILFLVEKLHGFVASAQSLTVSLTPKGARS